jgi:hypothetical protein
MSPNGKPWTGGNLKQNYERMAKQQTAGHDTAQRPQQSQRAAVQDTAPVPHGERVQTPQPRLDASIPSAGYDTAQRPQPFTADEIASLKAIIAEKNAPKSPQLDLGAKLPRVIPEIKPPKGSGTSLRLRKEFLDDALERARKLWPDQNINQTRFLNWLLMWFAGIEKDPELAEVPVQGELLSGNEPEGT